MKPNTTGSTVIACIHLWIIVVSIQVSPNWKFNQRNCIPLLSVHFANWTNLPSRYFEFCGSTGGSRLDSEKEEKVSIEKLAVSFIKTDIVLQSRPTDDDDLR